MRYSSCVTSTPLKLLVTVLDDRSVSRCRALCCLFDLVMLRSNSGAPLIAFQCLLLVCFRGYLSETMRACDQLHLRNPTYQQARTIHYLLSILFQPAVCMLV